MSKPTANDPVNPMELEDASLHIAQAASTLRVLCDSHEGQQVPEMQMALGLVSEYLHRCAFDLSDMHMRHSRAVAAPAAGVFEDGMSTRRPPIAGLPPARECPLCGASDDICIVQTSPDIEKFGLNYRASCGNCGVDAPGGPVVMDAVSGWNTRGKLYETADQTEVVAKEKGA